jgi:hypothetical protein
MSTIRHPIQNHTWWYAAAAAVIGGLLAVLVATVFSSYLGSDATSPSVPAQTSAVRHFPGPTFREVCFAHRTGQSDELAQSGCTTP